MKTIIIYKSKTGFTKQYATWISEALNCEVKSVKSVNAKELKDYDLVIFGSRVHAGFIDGLKKIKALGLKKLVVFATGATPKEATESIEKIWNDNFTVEEENPHFYFPSGLCYEKMGFFDRLIMKMVSKMMQKKKDKTDIEEGFAHAISKSFDDSDKKYIEPLVNYVKNSDKK